MCYAINYGVSIIHWSSASSSIKLRVGQTIAYIFCQFVHFVVIWSWVWCLRRETVSHKYWNQILFLENDITHNLQMYTEMRMRWTELESQNDCKSSWAAQYWMLWIRSIHSSQHATHMGNFSRLRSHLTKGSPHQIVEGGRGRLTGIGDAKGLLQLLYMGLTKPTNPSGNSKPKTRMPWNMAFESQSKRELVIAWKTNSNASKPMSLSFLAVTILKGHLKIPKYLIPFTIFLYLFKNNYWSLVEPRTFWGLQIPQNCCRGKGHHCPPSFDYIWFWKLFNSVIQSNGQFHSQCHWYLCKGKMSLWLQCRSLKNGQ